MKKVLAILTAVALLAALAVPALAERGTFTPSCYTKDAPSTTGNSIVSYNDGSGSWEFEESVDDGAVTTINLDQSYYSDDAEIRDTMDWVYSELNGAGDMFEVAWELEDAMIHAGIDLTEETKQNYVIRDMFYVQYDGELEPGRALKTTFVDMKLEPGDFLYVMVNVGGDYWTVVPPQYVEITADGDVNVVLQDVGPIAFVVEKGE